MEDREQKIRDRAYELWVADGRPDGRESEHWTQAALELGYDDAAPSESNEIPRGGEEKTGGALSPGQIPPPD